MSNIFGIHYWYNFFFKSELNKLAKKLHTQLKLPYSTSYEMDSSFLPPKNFSEWAMTLPDSMTPDPLIQFSPKFNPSAADESYDYNSKSDEDGSSHVSSSDDETDFTD